MLALRLLLLAQRPARQRLGCSPGSHCVPVRFGCCAAAFRLASGCHGLAALLRQIHQIALVIVQIAFKRPHGALPHQPEFFTHGAQQRPIVADQHERAVKTIERQR